MRWTSVVFALSLVLSVGACGKEAAKAPAAASAAREIAWREGDVDAALSEAKASGKPVMLYWGAKWCPPCNLLKSTLFKDAKFIAQTQAYVPVYLDGDSRGAQRWGEQFGIVGYPTVVVLSPDGAEVTRLSNGMTAEQLAEVLRVSAGRTKPIEEVFAQAQKDSAALTADEWRLLAAFDWQNDPKHFGEQAQAAKVLEALAQTAPDAALKRRFALLALAVGVERDKDGKYVLTADQKARLTGNLPLILASAQETKTDRQELSYSIPDLVAALPDEAQKAKLASSLIAALDKVYADESLPLPDRLAVTHADVTLSKGADGTVPAEVLTKVRERTAAVDQAAKDAMVRQSVISEAAFLLYDAGDKAGAKKMLEAELTRSASPYYYMLDLASIAEDEKDGKAAIDWARKAYEAAEGPATRVQWAIEYSKVVLRQAPGDKAAVEASADAVIDELAKSPGGYYQRTRTRVASWGELMRKWAAGHGGGAVLARLDAKMAGVCAQEADAAATCRKWTQAA